VRIPGCQDKIEAHAVPVCRKRQLKGSVGNIKWLIGIKNLTVLMQHKTAIQSIKDIKLALFVTFIISTSFSSNLI
jgi:hypothetical protein